MDQWNQAEACSCLAPEEPAYCNTDYFILAHILRKVENQEKRIIRYKFKTLELIADPNNVVGNQKQKQFYTSLASSSCGIDLKVGARYLIAGNAKGPNQRLLLNLCQTYVEEYMQPNWNKDQFKNLLLTCPNVNQIIKT